MPICAILVVRLSPKIQIDIYEELCLDTMLLIYPCTFIFMGQSQIYENDLHNDFALFVCLLICVFFSMLHLCWNVIVSRIIMNALLLLIYIYLYVYMSRFFLLFFFKSFFFLYINNNYNQNDHNLPIFYHHFALLSHRWCVKFFHGSTKFHVPCFPLQQ